MAEQKKFTKLVQRLGAASGAAGKAGNKTVIAKISFNPMAHYSNTADRSPQEDFPLDNMTMETNVTIYPCPAALDVLGEKTPPDGAFIHGLYMDAS